MLFIKHFSHYLLFVLIFFGFFFASPISAQEILPDYIPLQAQMTDLGVHFYLYNAGNAKASEKFYIKYEWVGNNREIIPGKGGKSFIEAHIGDIGKWRIRESREMNHNNAMDSKVQDFLWNPPRGAKELKMTIDSHSEFLELDETNNTAFMNIVLPDLVLEKASLKDVGVSFFLKNQGNGSARPDYYLRFRWVNENGEVIPTQEGLKEFTQIVLDSDIRINESREVTSSYLGQDQTKFVQYPPRGAKYLEITADARDVIVESNEENNSTRVTIPFPDLRFGEFSWNGEGVTIEVFNSGEGSIRKNFPMRFIWKGVDESSLDYTFYAPMRARDRRVITSQDSFFSGERKFFKPPPKGATQLTITLDPENIIPENDEGNNYAEVDIPFPDIKFGSLTLTSEGVGLTILNQGKILNTEPIEIRFHWTDKDGNNIPKLNQSNGIDLIRMFNTTFVPVGRVSFYDSKKTLDQAQDEFINNPPQNAERLNILIDPNDVIFESNEKNNDGFTIVIPKGATGEDLAKKDEEIILQEIAKELVESDKVEEIKKELDPTVPGDATYFLKSAFREAKNFFTFDPEKKVELRAEIATERTLEINKLIEKGEIEKALQHLERYIKDLSKLDYIMKKLIKEDPARAEELKKERVRMEIETQFVFGKLEREAEDRDEKLAEKIENTVAETILHVKEALEQIPEESVKEIIEETLDSSGTPFHELQNLEILESISEASPVIEAIKDEKLETFAVHVEIIPEEEQQILSEYVEESGGDQEVYVSLLADPVLANISPVIQQELIEVQQAITQEQSIAEKTEVTENTEMKDEENDPSQSEEIEKSPEIVPEELPDLLFSKVWFWQQFLRANIKNGGTVVSGDFELGFEWLKDGNPVGELFLSERRSLDPGAEAEWRDVLNQQSNNNTPGYFLSNQPDDYTHLRLILDPENKVKESNEENNMYELARFFPDIQIIQFQINPSAYGDRLYLYTENRDYGVIRDGFPIWFQWVDKARKVLGKEVEFRATYSPMGIYKSSGWNIDLRKDYYNVGSYAEYASEPPKGAYELLVIVDPKNEIKESNEENNQAYLKMPNIEILEEEPKEPECTEDIWKCDSWGECSREGKQSRKCELAEDCKDVSTDKPSESQTCTPKCIEDVWSCSDWSTCSEDGTQTRTCELKDDCSLVENVKPSESQTCTPPKVETSPAKEKFSDLTIESAEIIIAKEEEGFSGAFSPDILNEGEKDALISQLRLRIDLGHDGSWDQTAPFIQIDELKAGGRDSRSWILVFGESSGQALAEFCVDVENNINENDEDDNCVIQEFAIE